VRHPTRVEQPANTAVPTQYAVSNTREIAAGDSRSPDALRVTELTQSDDKPDLALRPQDAAVLIFTNVVWGSTYVVARAAMDTMPPLVLAFARLALAALVMALLGCHRGGSPSGAKPDGRALRALIVMGLIGVGLAKVLGYQGLRLSTATDGALIVNLEALFTAGFAGLLLRQKLAGVQVAGVLVGCAGGLALTWPADAAALAGGRPLGNAIMIASIAAEAAASVLGVMAMRHFSALQVTALATYLGAAALAPFAWWEWHGAGYATPWLRWNTLAAVAYLALGATALTYWLWYRVLERVDAGRAAAFLYVQPLVGVALGIGIRSEWPSWLGWTGGALIAAGLVLSGSGSEPAAAREQVDHHQERGDQKGEVNQLTQQAESHADDPEHQQESDDTPEDTHASVECRSPSVE
jgi:drug/metabolite transporter (DMT)-like permease